MRVRNFCAGPATMPDQVLEEVKSELLDWGSSGMSIMEMSHRSSIFNEVAFNAKNDFIPTLPLRDVVVFPSMIVPLFVGRDKSIKALNEVMKNNKKIILITQKNAEIDDPNSEDLYTIGCEGKILQLLKLPDGTVKVLVEGTDRVRILECKNDKEYLTCSIEVVKDERSKGNIIYPYVVPREFLKFNKKEIPLTPISNSNYVACNEFGIWKKIKTDKYGFNNKWQMQFYVKMYYDHFFNFNPELLKYKI